MISIYIFLTAQTDICLNSFDKFNNYHCFLWKFAFNITFPFIHENNKQGEIKIKEIRFITEEDATSKFVDPNTYITFNEFSIIYKSIEKELFFSVCNRLVLIFNDFIIENPFLFIIVLIKLLLSLSF